MIVLFPLKQTIARYVDVLHCNFSCMLHITSLALGFCNLLSAMGLYSTKRFLLLFHI